MFLILKIIILAVVSGAIWASENYTYSKEQLNARYYYDLGPAEIDVSQYPAAQQAHYQVFSRTCSQCHTLARPINAPITTKADWKRYIKRMHMRVKSKKGTDLSPKAARAIADFLVFDSNVRKVQSRAAFQTRDAELRAFFNEAQKEKRRVQMNEDLKKVREAPMGPVEKPQP